MFSNFLVRFLSLTKVFVPSGDLSPWRAKAELRPAATRSVNKPIQYPASCTTSVVILNQGQRHSPVTIHRMNLQHHWQRCITMHISTTIGNRSSSSSSTTTTTNTPNFATSFGLSMVEERRRTQRQRENVWKLGKISGSVSLNTWET